MKIRVLFNYTISTIPPRCRKPRLVTHNDGAVEVEIQELTAEQAPVAIRASGTKLTDDVEYAYDLRWWNGRLWSAVQLDDNCEPRAYTNGMQDWEWPAMPEILDLRLGSRNVSWIFPFHSNFGSNPRESVEADIQAFALDYVVIEGKPYRPVREPRYVVMTFGLGSNHGGTSLMVSASSNSNIKDEAFFGLLELEGAKAYATEVAERRADTKSLPMRYGWAQFEVLMPQVLTVRNPATRPEAV